MTPAAVRASEVVMPLPYTKEAIAALRHAERLGTPAEEIQQLLGWDDGMFERRCREHKIRLISIGQQTKPGQVERLAARYPVNAKVSVKLQPLIDKLTPRRAEIFRILLSRPIQAIGDEQWVTSTAIADAIGISDISSVVTSIRGLARQLNRMDAEYKIDARKGPGGGYRIIIDESRL